jgi:hypothetical protein
VTDVRRERPTVGFGWEPRDRYPWLGPLAAVVLVVGTSMAVFGLPPIDLHGPLHYMGIMDPLCGGTRGVRYALRGELGLAWRYNPLSIVVVAAALAGVARHAYGSATGRWLGVRVPRTWPVIAAGAVLLVALKVNEQAHADLLGTRMGSTAALSGLALYFAPRIAAAVVAAWILLRRRRRRA